MLGPPAQRVPPGVLDHTLQPGIGRQFGTEDAGVELAVLHHREQGLAVGRALDKRRVAILEHMRVLEIDPVHAVDVDTVIILQMATQPGAGGLGIGAHADAPAGEIESDSLPRSELYKSVPCWNRPSITHGISTSGLPSDFACRKVTIAISLTS